MKYSSEITIDLPLERVVELFDSEENLAKWQKGLQSTRLLSGEPGEAGARTEMIYELNGRRIEMVETIVKRHLPQEFTALYEAKGVWNHNSNSFQAAGSDKTRWLMENEFRFSGMMRLMSIFMRGAFAKQTQKDMQRFKDFAESSGQND